MAYEDEPNGCVLITMLLFIGAMIGFFTGVFIDRNYMKQLHWQELVRRGYAVEVESSAGKGYKWKEEVK